MTRNEKVIILRAIKEGKLSIKILLPPKIYLCFEKENKPGFFEIDGKEYTKEDFKEFCEGIERKNNERKFLKIGKRHKEDKIIVYYL